MVSYQAVFDDGLKVNPPLKICDVTVQTIITTTATINIALPIQWVGMPVQPLSGDRRLWKLWCGTTNKHYLNQVSVVNSDMWFGTATSCMVSVRDILLFSCYKFFRSGFTQP